MNDITFFEVSYDEDHENSFFTSAQEAVDEVESQHGEGSAVARQCVLRVDECWSPVSLTKVDLAYIVDGEFALTDAGRKLVKCEHQWLTAKPDFDVGAGAGYEFCPECNKLREVWV